MLTRQKSHVFPCTEVDEFQKNCRFGKPTEKIGPKFNITLSPETFCRGRVIESASNQLLLQKGVSLGSGDECEGDILATFNISSGRFTPLSVSFSLTSLSFYILLIPSCNVKDDSKENLCMDRIAVRTCLFQLGVMEKS